MNFFQFAQTSKDNVKLTPNIVQPTKIANDMFSMMNEKSQQSQERGISFVEFPKSNVNISYSSGGTVSSLPMEEINSENAFEMVKKLENEYLDFSQWMHQQEVYLLQFKDMIEKSTKEVQELMNEMQSISK